MTAELPNCRTAELKSATFSSSFHGVCASALIGLSLLSAQSSACSFSSSPKPVTLPLKIRVVDHGTPVRGVKAVVLAWDSKDSDVVLSGTTNSEGEFVVERLGPGKYFAGLQHPSGDRNEEIVVSAGRPIKDATDTLDFEWPGDEPLETQRLVGRVKAPQQTGSIIICCGRRSNSFPELH